MPLVPLLLALLTAAPVEKPKLVVLELVPGGGLEASLIAPFTDAVTAEAQRTSFFEVVSSRDVSSLLGIERQRQLLGCTSEGSSCMTELSGALGARFVLSGTVAKLGQAYQLTLTTLDSQRATPLGRATRLASSLEALRATLPWAVAEATATPMPEAPSKALPVTLVAVGGAGMVFGLVWGAVHLAQEQQLASVLNSAANSPGVLDTRASYQQELTRLTTQRWVALSALGVGAVAVAVGSLLFGLSDTPKVAVVPTASGFALVGRWP